MASSGLNYIIDSVSQNQQQLCLFLATLTTLFLYHQYKKLTFWSSRGIKTPMPLPIVGNGITLVMRAKRHFDIEWRNKYGKVYGYYLGTEPRLVIADAEILRKICIKDFQYFPNHHFDSFRNKFQVNFLVQLLDLRWKKVRSLMSPTFTSGKIKRMFKLMCLCSNEMIEMLDENNNSVVDTKEIVSLYTMDVITTCCYALKLTRPKKDDNQSADSKGDNNNRSAFVDVAQNITQVRLSKVLISLLFPETLLKWLGFSSAAQSSFDNLHRKAANVIERRRASKNKDHNDYLQMLMDARFGAKMELTDMDDKENHHVGLTQESILQDQAKMEKEVMQQQQQLELTDLELVSNVMFLFIVGYETTATLMSHFLYIQAHYPDIQEKLYQELKGIVGEDGSFDYDSVTSATYLDAVVSETLRVMTPVFFMDRSCSQDYYLEEYNMTIPKGTILNLSYYTIMNDPDYWPEPEKFKPERFLSENRQNIVPGSYCPFGLGPRHCIGYRFSLTEAKLGLARLVVRYQFKPAPNSVFPPKPKLSVFLNTHKDLNVICSRR